MFGTLPDTIITAIASPIARPTPRTTVRPRTALVARSFGAGASAPTGHDGRDRALRTRQRGRPARRRDRGAAEPFRIDSEASAVR